MSLAKTIGRVHADLETATRTGEFFALARHMAMAKGLPIGAEADAAMARLTPRVQSILKTSVAAGTIGDASWGGVLSDYQLLASAFLQSLAGIAVFDTLLANGMRKIPLRTRIVASSAAVVGANVNELNVKPIGSLSLAPKDIALQKAAAIVVATAELLKLVPAGLRLFENELKAGVSVATDMKFLADLYAGTTPTASAGNTLTNVMADLTALIGGLTLGEGSRVYIIASPSNVAKLALKVTTAGDVAFPALGVNGGQVIRDVTVLPSSSVPSGAVLAIDADGLAGDTELPVLRGISHGDVQLNTAPDSPPTASTLMHNLWQHDERALYCERWFGFVKIRTGAVSAISNASY